DEALVAPVEEGIGEVAVERAHAIRAVVLVGVQDRLGVALRAEGGAARHQLVAQLDVIEYFAVEGDPEVAIRGGERLSSAGEIDDRKPAVPEGRAAVVVDAAVVRPAVAHRLDHPGKHFARRERPGRKGKIARYAAHGKSEPSGAPATFVASRLVLSEGA